ncbi:hypothetical protein [Streptomyces sp. NPDC102264]|uniref:hypothetical protein n=1 Tax=Streptomyces sp. NPDC102264 TaxID=3366149 RepID=UPI003828F397
MAVSPCAARRLSSGTTAPLSSRSADWGAVKTRWGLSIEPAAQAALTEMLSQCPNMPVEVTLARAPLGASPMATRRGHAVLAASG